MALRWFRLLGLLTLMVVVYFVFPWPRHVEAGSVVRGIVALLVLCLLAFGLYQQLKRQLDEDRRVDGLFLGIVFVVLVFAFIFYVMSREPNQIAGLHTKVDGLYFTLSTLTTVGFGDVHAVSQPARVLVIIQLVFNGIFLAAAAGLLTSRIRAAAQARVQRRSHPQGDAAD
jgi:uncharacterized membrane protein